MRRLEHLTLNDRAYGALKKGLMSGQFKPGEVLTIRHLAAEYGISATPVREALQRLVAERALELLRNRSIGVPIPTLEKFVELRRIRCLLEGFAGELATPHFRRADLARLARIIEEIDVDIATNNPAGYLRRNEKFHFLIYERAHSPQMLRIIQDLWTQVGPFFNSLFEDRSYLAEANDGHRKIIAAIRSGDPAAVRDAVVWDIGEAAESLMQRLPELKAPAGEGKAPGRSARPGRAPRTPARRKRRAAAG